MQRVVVLSHVKATSVASNLTNNTKRRIAWRGGKISSNKAEALQKFYQRKLRTGDHLTAQQLKTMQTTLAVVETKHERGLNNPKKGLATHRRHTKVTAAGNQIVLKTGRVLGPKINLNPTTKKAGRRGNAKQQGMHQPRTTCKMSLKQTETSSVISLEEKLGLPLHALVQGKAKGRSTRKRG